MPIPRLPSFRNPLPACAVALAGLLLAACGAPTDLSQPHRVRIDDVAWTQRWADSAAVRIEYTLGACDEFVRSEHAQDGLTVNVSVFAVQAHECPGERLGSTMAIVQAPMASDFRVVAREPDGSAREFVIPGFSPPQMCRGPAVGLANAPGPLTVGADTLLVVRRFCPDVPPVHATWALADTTVATIAPRSDSTALVHAKAAGTTTLTVSEPQKWSMQVNVVVVAPK